MKERRKLAWGVAQTIAYVLVENLWFLALIHLTCSWNGGMGGGLMYFVGVVCVLLCVCCCVCVCVVVVGCL